MEQIRRPSDNNNNEQINVESFVCLCENRNKSCTKYQVAYSKMRTMANTVVRFQKRTEHDGAQQWHFNFFSFRYFLRIFCVNVFDAAKIFLMGKKLNSFPDCPHRQRLQNQFPKIAKWIWIWISTRYQCACENMVLSIDLIELRTRLYSTESISMAV